MDKTDKRIIQKLLENARKKNSILARELNMPATTLQERIKKLEERGTIKGYSAILDHKKMGYDVQAFIAVSLNKHESDDIRTFEKEVKKVAGVRSCYHMSGRFDYMLHVMVRDLTELGDLVKKGITSLPDFGRCETFLIFSEIESEDV